MPPQQYNNQNNLIGTSNQQDNNSNINNNNTGTNSTMSCLNDMANSNNNYSQIFPPLNNNLTFFMNLKSHLSDF